MLADGRRVDLFRQLLAVLVRQRSVPHPPKELMLAIGSTDDDNFTQIGDEFLHYFIELTSLKPYENVLDVGCGAGRMAVPLTKYLNRRGHYEGFDVHKACVDWCRNNITPRYPNFRFRWIDVFNGKYNPTGKSRPSDFKFPYQDESFDFIFLASVFTHMLPADVENYMAELARVLKPSGRCLATYFLLNEESMRLIELGKSSLNFSSPFGVYRSTHEIGCEQAVAYDESFIRSLYDKNMLIVREPIRYGAWCGRTDFLSGQDIVLAWKDKG